MRSGARGWLPGRADASGVKTPRLPPPPPADYGGIGPEGGGTARATDEPRRRAVAARDTRVGGAAQGKEGRGPGSRSLGGRRLGQHAPRRGGDQSHRAPITGCRGPKPRSLEA